MGLDSVLLRTVTARIRVAQAKAAGVPFLARPCALAVWVAVRALPGVQEVLAVGVGEDFYLGGVNKVCSAAQ